RLHTLRFDPVAVDIDGAEVADHQAVPGEFIVGDFQFVAVPPEPATGLHALGLDPVAVDVDLAVVPDDETVARQFVVSHLDLAGVDPDAAARIDRQAAFAFGLQSRLGEVGRFHGD